MPKITLEAARVNAGLTQEQMARKLGLTRGYYGKLESGEAEIKPVYVMGICQITGFSMNDLILPARSTKGKQ